MSVGCLALRATALLEKPQGPRKDRRLGPQLDTDLSSICPWPGPSHLYVSARRSA